jgi:hypothetical protein
MVKYVCAERPKDINYFKINSELFQIRRQYVQEVHLYKHWLNILI